MPNKNLIFLGGPMGVGKTTVAERLLHTLPKSVMLDGDWCWKMEPFIVTEETKAMVQGNILHLLQSFLDCSAFENVIFCWVLHEQALLDALLSALGGEYTLWNYSLVCTPQALEERLARDIAAGSRTADVLPRALERLTHYAALDTRKLDTTDLSAAKVAERIRADVLGAAGRRIPMLSIFSRRELTMTYSMERQAALRECLSAAGIRYTLRTRGPGSGLGLSGVRVRARLGGFGEDPRHTYQYYFYVHKSDYERAKALLG